MSTKDEKDWLRAILEGKVKPGDAEWERIWKEEDFTGVRRVLKEVGMRKKDELVADREKMWRVVKQYRGEGKNRRRVSAWRWVSAAMLPLLLGGILWISSREKKDVLVAGISGSRFGRSYSHHRSGNTSCRVAYGTRGKDRFVLACR